MQGKQIAISPNYLRHLADCLEDGAVDSVVFEDFGEWLNSFKLHMHKDATARGIRTDIAYPQFNALLMEEARIVREALDKVEK